jgi:hypothetical protein
MALPGGDDFYMLSVAAICWATWKCRNSVLTRNLLKILVKLYFLLVLL